MAPKGPKVWGQRECVLGQCGLDFGGRWSSKGEQPGLKRGPRYQSPKLMVLFPPLAQDSLGLAHSLELWGKSRGMGCVPGLHCETQIPGKGGAALPMPSRSWARVCGWEPGGEGLVQRWQRDGSVSQIRALTVPAGPYHLPWDCTFWRS